MNEAERPWHDKATLFEMRLLIRQTEAQYFVGAEKMLGFFLEGLVSSDCQVAVAFVQDSRVSQVIPSGIKRIYLGAWIIFGERLVMNEFTFGEENGNKSEERLRHCAALCRRRNPAEWHGRP